MYPDEFRSEESLRLLRKRAALRNPDALFEKYYRLSVAVEEGKLKGSEISDVSNALNRERTKSKALSMELDETRAKLIALRSSRTMRAGKLIRAPFDVLRPVIKGVRQRTQRLLSK